MMSCSIWEEPDKIKETIFKPEKKDSKVYENEVEIHFIDLPYLHQLSVERCIYFFQALRDLKENKDGDHFEIFELKSIRLLIEYHWPLSKEYTIKKLFIPFVVYLIAFWFYTNFVDQLGEYLDTLNIVPWLINLTILVILSLYFLWNEAR
jgi:hypothetical protein